MKRPKLKQKDVKRLFYYDPLLGWLCWKNDAGRGRIKDGCRAGCEGGSGYRLVNIKCNTYAEHLIIWIYMEGYWPEHQIDHINRDTTDNRWCNLRHVSSSCNLRNRGQMRTNTSGVTGVGIEKYGYRPSIGVNGKLIRLGTFKNFDDAVMKRWEAEVKYGYPNCQTTSDSYQYLKENNLL